MEIQFMGSKDLSLWSRLDADSVKGWPEVSLSILKAWSDLFLHGEWQNFRP